MAERYQADVEKFLKENEPAIKKWIKWRPSVERSYDDLLSAATSGEMKYYPVERKDWEQHTKKEGVAKSAGGFFRKEDSSIHFPKDRWEEIMPHETMHYLASHWPIEGEDVSGRKRVGYGTPKKINPYLKADIALKGWLPSIHPGGRRPVMPGKGRFSGWWNKNMATEGAKYSTEQGYHPWFDEHSFDIFDKKTGGVQRAPKEKKMAGGLGRIYQYLTDTGQGDYEVQKGDTLSGIGQRSGQDWRDIAEENKFATQPGPYMAPGTRAPHELQAGETISGVRGEGRSLRDDLGGLLGALKGIPGKFAGAAQGARGPQSVEDYLNQASQGGFADEGANRGLQESLKDAGFYSGDIDSQIGPMSTSAIRAYQADRDSQGSDEDETIFGTSSGGRDEESVAKWFDQQGQPDAGGGSSKVMDIMEKLGLISRR